MKLKTQLKYVNHIIRKNSYEELREIFINTTDPLKEMSESYSAFIKLKSHVENYDLQTFLHIGDGSWCRTGLLNTFYSKSYNISIDPDANKVGKLIKWLDKWNVENFEFHSKRFQEVEWNDECVITLVHAHVSINDVIKHYPNWKYIYCSPCCHKSSQIFSNDFLKNNSYIECIEFGVDEHILGEKNEYYIYKNKLK